MTLFEPFLNTKSGRVVKYGQKITIMERKQHFPLAYLLEINKKMDIHQ
jgi:hypothetical protein